ncbi:DUF2490 domain-containing protein [Emticicia sp. CRIBPO]|uniref:DUF2490 domain-containing protein n=1 Tax=Emticicia sp. CRIBPO TaxID=2683258 RepID=UPI0014133378|nr:DUF2490 domain-containing protein [Emticicia sp. CRIBPO]NBA84210.1 DUF2490 domain-containing protein [Emticicia sp. CRIBPO]
MTLRNPALIILLMLFSEPALFAQKRYNHNIVWGRLALTDTLSSKLRWELFIQHRRQNTEESDWNVVKASQFTSYWLWFHYNLSPSTKLSVSPVGYFKSWILIAHPTDIDRDGIREFRWAARLDHETKGKYFNVLNRHNLEYRIRDLQNNNVFQPNWRVRYMIRLEKPLKASWIKKPTSLVAYEEVFIQFGKAVRSNPNVFDQNRLYLGVNHSFSKRIKGNLGYIWGIQQRNSGNEFDFSNILWGVLTIYNVFSQFRGNKKPAADHH